MTEPWNAAWMWLDPDRFPGCQRAPVSWWSKDAHREGEVAAAGLLRLVIGLEQVPAPVRLRLSADSRYRLWINETWIGAGPALVGGSYARTEAPDWWYYDEFDVAGYLRPGPNVFAVEVTCGPDQQTHFSLGRPGFAAELRGLAPGGAWRGIAFDGYRTGRWTGLTRSCDLGCYPPGWLGAEFDDRVWPALVPVPGRAPLLPHSLPPLAEKPVAPAGSSCCRFTAGTNQWWIGAHRITLRMIQAGADVFRWRMMNRQLPPPQFGVIQVRNNQSWHGDLLAITNGVVSWQHPAALDPFHLPLADVQRVRPLLRPLPVTPVAEQATVRLGNGDVISGLLAPAEGDNVRVTPWYSGPVTVPRRQVTPHAPVAGARPLDAPLMDGALWLGEARWQGGLPDRLRLDFEVVWGEPSPAGVHMRFYQGEKEGLTASFSPSSVLLSAMPGNQNASTNFPGGALTNLVAGGCVSVTVLVDRPNRQLRLLVDGQPVAEWQAKDIAIPTGDVVRIDGVGYPANMALRHIVLREWREDPAPAPAARLVGPPARTPAEARVILHNGDFLTLSDVTADARTVSGKHALLGPVTLNLASVRALDGERCEAPRPPGSGAATKR